MQFSLAVDAAIAIIVVVVFNAVKNKIMFEFSAKF